MMPNYWQRTLERRLNRRGFLSLAAAAGATTVLSACNGDSEPGNAAATGDGGNDASVPGRPKGWTEATHGNDVAPDFKTVFPADRVNQLTLTISPANWQAMLDDMTTLFGPRGSGSGFGGQPPGDQQQPGNQMRPDGTTFGRPKPIWVAGDVGFNGKTWTNVGIRFKGNSSLRQSWGTGTDRLPFKLDFDEWEDDFPEINNQRFYGFKQLSLSNNVGDPTHMRETLAYDVYEDAGLPATNTAFYEVLLDRGEGATSLGIYTAIEVIDDTMVGRIFGDDKGNIYEAEGSGAALVADATAARIKESFQKENNEDTADWSDIEKFHAILHSEKRISDNAAWRKDLEAVFDVPVFLEWLAASAALEHWDTYGAMPHNYYLYNDGGKLTWISWDHNFILGAISSRGGAQQNPNAPAGGQQRQGGPSRNVTLGKTEVSGSQWPLIRYLMDVPEYFDAYRRYLREVIEGPFNATKMESRYAAWSRLLRPYAEKEGTVEAYDRAVQVLIDKTRERNQAVAAFLAG